MNFVWFGEEKGFKKFDSMIDSQSSRKLNEEWQLLIQFQVTAHDKMLKDHSFF